jgi:hypothetical protein
MSRQPYTFRVFNHHDSTALLYLQRAQQQLFPLDMLWVYRPQKEEVVTVRLVPQMVEVSGTTLKAGNQRMMIDLLRMVTFHNTHNRFWKAVIEDRTATR